MGPKKYISVIVFSWLFLDILWCNGCWDEEKIALLPLKQFFNDPVYPLNWNKSGDHSTSYCCKWERVRCNSVTGRVTEINLVYSRGLNPLDLLYLNTSYFLPFKELRILNLFGNNIGGCLEEEGFEKLSRLSNLEFLDLSFNRFNSNILSSIGSVTSLKVLRLSLNQLSGTIDTQELNNLSNLKELDMGYNQIEGFTSSNDAKPRLRLFDLEILDLRSNSFNNTILSSLVELSRLKSLYLSGNQLRGLVHVKELEPLTNLERLDMRYNHIEEFVGTKELAIFSNMEELLLNDSILDEDFLQSIGSLTSLRILQLNNCSLKGTLPNQVWCELKNLQELYLKGNELEGRLPPCLANLSSLQKLDLSHNQFIGNIASNSIARLVSIESLWLENNHFQIPISFELFSNFSNLKLFYGGDNEFTIDFAPKSWTPKFQLQTLSLSNCALPNFLYYQYDLRYVSISNGNFGTVFPSWLLENNTRMIAFVSRNNSYTGLFQLPSHSSQNLQILDISNNRLQGQIPSNLSIAFPILRILSAFGNAFQGNIPLSFGEMKHLEFLELSNNRMFGQIPERFFMQQSSLNTLLLSNNKLWGPIFPTNFSSTILQYLKLDGNNLMGEIPDLSSSKYLRWLDIGDNLVSRKLPKSMANLSNLEYIDLANNNLEGPISSELCQLGRLQSLVLSHNNLSGFIPTCLNQMQFLKRIHLDKNRLTGLMPLAFMNNSDLIILNLSNNNFTGTIPNWIGTLSGLRILLLQGNHFHNEIPTTLCQLNGLSILDLSSNSLSGHLPPCLGNLTLTTKEKLSDEVVMKSNAYNIMDFNYNIEEVVRFTSKNNLLHYKGKPLDYMRGIDLSCNHFTGKIPIEFGNLSNVRGLNLSYNNLTGTIPTSFSNLKQLESLDLSHNNLSGHIPHQLTQLNSLGTFSVAYNNLSGPLPNRGAQFGTFNETSYEGNPYLCGPPLINSCNDTNPVLPTHDSFDGDSEDGGFIDIYDFYVSFAASYLVVLLAIVIVLWINPYWRRQWLYAIEVMNTKCYYFFVDMFYWLANILRNQPHV